MDRFARNSWLAAIVLLIIAQTGAIAHAYEHELGTFQDQVCASCVSASHVLSACLDHGVQPDSQPFAAYFSPESVQRGHSIAVVSAKQRGPPTFL
ncbi:MAG: hypothetical protein OEN22_03395 [Gammaproteobacteria bacterium]|nr:hypothetical protein [Gammaproteobacteria bacterium]